MAEKDKTYFVVTYRDPVEQKTTSLKAKTVDDSSLGLSFIRVSDFVFDTESLVVNPDEEALRKRMENTKSLHLSIYTILSIQEIGLSQEGLKFSAQKSNLFILPSGPKPPPTKE